MNHYCVWCVCACMCVCACLFVRTCQASAEMVVLSKRRPLCACLSVCVHTCQRPAEEGSSTLWGISKTDRDGIH